MKGVVKYRRGKGFVELREVEETPPLPNQVKIEVKASGICGSDIHIWNADINIPIRTPVVLGHEFSGVVVEKGTGVSDDVRIGDRVTGEPSAYVCGRCRYCRSEHYNLCPERKILGYNDVEVVHKYFFRWVAVFCLILILRFNPFRKIKKTKNP